MIIQSYNTALYVSALAENDRYACSERLVDNTDAVRLALERQTSRTLEDVLGVDIGFFLIFRRAYTWV